MKRLNVDVYEVYNSLQKPKIPKEHELSDKDLKVLNSARSDIKRLFSNIENKIPSTERYSEAYKKLILERDNNG